MTKKPTRRRSKKKSSRRRLRTRTRRFQRAGHTQDLKSSLKDPWALSWGPSTPKVRHVKFGENSVKEFRRTSDGYKWPGKTKWVYDPEIDPPPKCVDKFDNLMALS